MKIFFAAFSKIFVPAKTLFNLRSISISQCLSRFNFVKATAVVTAVCFVLTSFQGGAAAAIFDKAAQSGQAVRVFSDFVIPESAGKITEAKYFGSKQLVINIQDLHCHSEVQKNISKILASLDKKYNLGAVYLEGAFGSVDTSWLSSIKNKTIRQSITDYLLEKGKLTGTEYYSVLNDRPRMIKGIENKKLYLENFGRLKKILDSKKEIDSILSDLDCYIFQLKEQYYNPNQKKLGSLISRYRSGNIGADKFYGFLKKYCDKCGMEMDCYRNVSGYVQLLEKKKKLKYKLISSQLGQFISFLKQRLPYNEFQQLSDKTENFKNLDNLYRYLSAYSEQYAEECSRNFPRLSEFFNYIKLNEKINPPNLVKEEERLIGALRWHLSETENQRKVAFAVDFFRYMRDYFDNKISARDYEYFTANLAEFRQVWKQYVRNDRLSRLDPYFPVFKSFYRTNLVRNECFVNCLVGGAPAEISENTEKPGYFDDAQKALSGIKNPGDIKIVVAGGFHTEGIAHLLERRKISYLVITPAVTQDTRLSSARYEEIAREQSRYLMNAYALLAASCGPDYEEAKELFDGSLNAAEMKGKVAFEDIETAFSNATGQKYFFEAERNNHKKFCVRDAATQGKKFEAVYNEGKRQFDIYDLSAGENFSYENRRSMAKKSVIAAVFSAVSLFLQVVFQPALSLILVSAAVSWVFLICGALAPLAVAVILSAKYFFDSEWLNKADKRVKAVTETQGFSAYDREAQSVSSEVNNIMSDPVVNFLLNLQGKKTTPLVCDQGLNGTKKLFFADRNDGRIHVNYPLLAESRYVYASYNKYIGKIRMAIRHEIDHLNGLGETRTSLRDLFDFVLIKLANRRRFYTVKVRSGLNWEKENNEAALWNAQIRLLKNFVESKKSGSLYYLVYEDLSFDTLAKIEEIRGALKGWATVVLISKTAKMNHINNVKSLYPRANFAGVINLVEDQNRGYSLVLEELHNSGLKVLSWEEIASRPNYVYSTFSFMPTLVAGLPLPFIMLKQLLTVSLEWALLSIVFIIFFSIVAACGFYKYKRKASAINELCKLASDLSGKNICLTPLNGSLAPIAGRFSVSNKPNKTENVSDEQAKQELKNTYLVHIVKDFKVENPQKPPELITRSLESIGNEIPTFIFTNAGKETGFNYFCSDQMFVSGRDEPVTIYARIQLYEDEEYARAKCPVISLSCDVPIPVELLLGRGALVIASKIARDKDLELLLPHAYKPGTERSFIFEMHGPKTALANPGAVLDQYTESPIFARSFFIYNAGGGPDLLPASFAEQAEINPKYGDEIKSPTNELDLNLLGVAASNYVFGGRGIYNGLYAEIIHQRPDFGERYREELNWLKTEVYIPGILATKNSDMFYHENYVMITPSMLPGPYRIGKITGLPKLVEKTGVKNIILTNWNEPALTAENYGSPVGDDFFAGYSLTIDDKEVIKKNGFKNIDTSALMAPELGETPSNIDIAGVREREMEVMWKLFTSIVDVDAYESFIKSFKNANPEEEKEEQDLAREVLGEALLTRDAEFYLEALTIRYSGKINATDFKKREKLAKEYLEKLIKKVIRPEYASVYNELVKYNQSFIYEQWFKGYPRYKRSQYCVIANDRLENDLLAKKMNGDGNIYALFNYMMQMFYHNQMVEVINEIHKKDGKIFFEVNLPTLNMMVPVMIKYIFDMGFDGIKFTLTKRDVFIGTLEQFKGDMKMMGWQIKSEKPSAKIFVNAPRGSKVEEFLIRETSFNLCKTTGEFRNGAEIHPGDMLEIDACPDPEALKQIMEEVRESKAGDIALPAPVAFKDENYGYFTGKDRKKDLSYRMPSDINERKDIVQKVFEMITPIFTGRPVSLEATENEGYLEGVHFTQINDLTEEYWRSVIKSREYYEYSFTQPQIVSEEGIFGLVKTLHSFKYSGQKLSALLKNDEECKKIFELALESVRQTPGLGENEWKSGWLELRDHFQKGFENSSEEKKAFYVCELLGFLRGVAERITEANFRNTVDDAEFENEYDQNAFRSLLMLMNCVKADGHETGIPVELKLIEKDLAAIADASSVADLQKHFGKLPMSESSSIFLTKADQLYTKDAAFALLFLKAILNFRELAKPYPKNDLPLTPWLKTLISDKRIKEILNPILADIVDNGVITSMANHDIDEYKWVVSAIYDLFYNYGLAERKVKGLEERKKGKLIDIESINRITEAA